MQLTWYRSWPAPNEWIDSNLELKNRAHVCDNMDRIFLSKYDYRTVREHNSLQTDTGWPDKSPGFCMLEWDVALDPWSRRQFASIALEEPREVLVAAYRFHDTWSQWQGNEGQGPDGNSRPIQVGEERTDSFGLGCIYFPLSILEEFLAQMDHFGFTDATFGKWYHQKYGKARVTWKVHPQHLHDYETS